MSGLVSTTLARCADGFARVLRRVAVVGEGAQVAADLLHRGLELVQLIFGQRLGREQIHRARFRIAQQQIEHRQVVAQRLAAGGGRDDHHVLARLHDLERFGLVAVELGHVAADEPFAQLRMHRFGDIDVLRGARRLVADRADGRVVLLHQRPEMGEDGFQVRLARKRQLFRKFGKAQA